MGRRIILRKKDLNARGNGTQIARRVRLPDGSRGWATDYAQDIHGDWRSGAFLAAERRCEQTGVFPAGTLVLEYESAMRAGKKVGRAAVRAGIVTDGDKAIEWGLSWRRRGEDVEVKLPDSDEWVAV